jgi:bifunctional non-homologous end joining protein LigD
MAAPRSRVRAQAMTELLDSLPPALSSLLRAGPHPQWVEPMLATLTDQRFSSPEWIFERKLDGERCLAFRTEAGVRLLSRNRLQLNGTYPEVVDALLAHPQPDVVLDGEIVAFDHGRVSFRRLQGRMDISNALLARQTGIAVIYYVFDILHLFGHDLTELPLRTRKALLRHAVQFEPPLRFTAHRNTGGEAFFAEACTRGWEGLIAKRADSQYVGRRSRDWLKFKCVNRQEMVVGGFTDPTGTRVGLGALLIGYYEDGRLRYAGKVGTGFDVATLISLRERLRELEQRVSPFSDPVREPRVHRVRPELVAEVAYSEWTNHHLRHPRYVGLRFDKPAHTRQARD